MSSTIATASPQPLVSVLTPVYNGERYLAECIESVLGQTYQNWEYVIVNNCSTDRTFEIATRYADRDPRIRIVSNSDFVSALRNHNIALTCISPKSRYCKFVQADDLLFPTCLTEMVQVAEDHPSVGIVSSYQLWGSRVECDGLPYPSTVVPGREAIRMYFLQRKTMFSSMSGFLLRADLVRSRAPFLNEKYLFADTEVYFPLLQHYDYGFVHQVLSLWRMHEEALSASRAYNDWRVAELYFTRTYGPTYLTPEEYGRCLKQSLDRYYRSQGHEVFHFREKTFWQRHRTMMKEIGFRFSLLRLIEGTLREIVDLVFGPVKGVRRSMNYARGRRG